MWFCPYSCELCRRGPCLSDGCDHTGEPVLMVCESCGTLHVAFALPPVCVVCWARVEGAQPQ